MAKSIKPEVTVLLVLLMACSLILAATARPLDDAKDLNSAGRGTNTILGALYVAEVKTGGDLSIAADVPVQESGDESGPSPGVGH
ncbi:hypothetical protein DCAR_0309977 [Daucus carota subsp. sativus]|uniref:Uncharacterized protein n=1 Tax=Daucus carota subsp. sativus TaxID=79200 RepID=A0A165ZIQ3_DAUCS|nr:hypothetical protein DCAR_0309977 [Daucus carota subsp. sativus]